MAISWLFEKLAFDPAVDFKLDQGPLNCPGMLIGGDGDLGDPFLESWAALADNQQAGEGFPHSERIVLLTCEGQERSGPLFPEATTE